MYMHSISDPYCQVKAVQVAHSLLYDVLVILPVGRQVLANRKMCQRWLEIIFF